MAERIDGQWIDIPPAARCFQRYTSEQRADRAASFRLGYKQRGAVGEFFWTHPLVPDRAFATRKAALRTALGFFVQLLHRAGAVHDVDKLTDLDSFHADFVTGFETHGWWDRHRSLNRHHLTEPDGVSADVNLIDVLDFIADCVMAGMARSGSVCPLHLSPELLETAFQNTVALLTRAVVVDDARAAGESHA